MKVDAEPGVILVVGLRNGGWVQGRFAYQSNERLYLRDSALGGPVIKNEDIKSWFVVDMWIGDARPRDGAWSGITLSSGRVVYDSEAHLHTEKCGFDRNTSHSEDRYVCACGWRG